MNIEKRKTKHEKAGDQSFLYRVQVYDRRLSTDATCVMLSYFVLNSRLPPAPSTIYFHPFRFDFVSLFLCYTALKLMNSSSNFGRRSGINIFLFFFESHNNPKTWATYPLFLKKKFKKNSFKSDSLSYHTFSPITSHFFLLAQNLLQYFCLKKEKKNLILLRRISPATINLDICRSTSVICACGQILPLAHAW